jgi:hypothetical protein
VNTIRTGVLLADIAPRMPATGVSIVTTSALKPAFFARSIAPIATSRPPTRYN